jgi:uncharacterized coiled-coil protein SlyX
VSEELRRKIIDLESSLGLLQRDYELQNEVLLEQTRRIRQMELSIRRLMDQVTFLQANLQGGDVAGDERPPHY